MQAHVLFAVCSLTLTDGNLQMAKAHANNFRTMKRTAERKGFALEATAKATATAMAIIIKNTIQ